MRFLALSEVLRLHSDLVAETGGATGVRDLGRIQAALAQPMATFDGDELYPTIVDKAAALGFALVQGHAFIDGNKRIGHAAMEVFLMLNGFDLNESVDEQERAILSVASGTMTRDELMCSTPMKRSASSASDRLNEASFWWSGQSA